ncbi:hypothetical protein HRbin28_02073 [bacterium HR28]|nr:hypothetical protein HRbin28_02073 [bacterium HR28]
MSCWHEALGIRLVVTPEGSGAAQRVAGGRPTFTTARAAPQGRAHRVHGGGRGIRGEAVTRGAKG